MNVANEMMDRLLPADRILADLADVLNKSDNFLEFDPERIAVPKDSTHVVIYRRLQISDSDEPFMNTMSALVAVGGVKYWVDTIPIPVFCYSKLWYKLTGELITTDFDTDLDAM